LLVARKIAEKKSGKGKAVKESAAAAAVVNFSSLLPNAQENCRIFAPGFVNKAKRKRSGKLSSSTHTHTHTHTTSATHLERNKINKFIVQKEKQEKKEKCVKCERGKKVFPQEESERERERKQRGREREGILQIHRTRYVYMERKIQPK